MNNISMEYVNPMIGDVYKDMSCGCLLVLVKQIGRNEYRLQITNSCKYDIRSRYQDVGPRTMKHYELQSKYSRGVYGDV